MASSTIYSTGFGTAGGQREGLTDVLTVLEPTDLYLWNRLAHQDIESTYVEWTTYDLATAAQNSALEGGDFSADTLTAPTRAGNYTQINKKQVNVSRTMDKVAKAGRRSEYQFYKIQKTREMMRDIEYTLLQGTVSAGNATGGRGCKGAISWVTTNTSSGTAAGTSGYRALTLTLVDTALAGSFNQGGDANVMYLGSSLAATFAGLATAATDRRRVSDRADRLQNINRFYDNPQGLSVEIRVHRLMPTTTVLFLDESYFKVGVFDAPFHEMLAKAGDSVRGQVVTEYTLMSLQEKASASILQVV